VTETTGCMEDTGADAAAGRVCRAVARRDVSESMMILAM
jgi:hypothetical protein